MRCPEFPEKVLLLFHYRIVKGDRKERMSGRYLPDFSKIGKIRREHLNHARKCLTGF